MNLKKKRKNKNGTKWKFCIIQIYLFKLTSKYQQHHFSVHVEKWLTSGFEIVRSKTIQLHHHSNVGFFSTK